MFENHDETEDRHPAMPTRDAMGAPTRVVAGIEGRRLAGFGRGHRQRAGAADCTAAADFGDKIALGL